MNTKANFLGLKRRLPQLSELEKDLKSIRMQLQLYAPRKGQTTIHGIERERLQRDEQLALLNIERYHAGFFNNSLQLIPKH